MPNPATKDILSYGCTLICGLAGAMLALSSCATDLDMDAPRLDQQSSAYSPEVLGVFERTDGTALTFTVEYERAEHRDPVVAISELAPADAFSYLQYLGSRGATSLEVFLAVAPAGTEVPAVLREAHQREARNRGRSLEVREFSLANVPSMVVPTDSTMCDSLAAFENAMASSVFGLQTDSSDQDHALTHIPDFNGDHVFAAMCNYDNSPPNDAKYAQFCTGLVTCDAPILVPDGHRVVHTWFNATTRRRVRAVNLSDGNPDVTSYLGIGFLGPAG